jgi:hypothetical protein
MDPPLRIAVNPQAAIICVTPPLLTLFRRGPFCDVGSWVKQTQSRHRRNGAYDPIETCHAACAGDWSGRIFAAQGSAVRKGALRWHDRPRAGISFVFCRSMLSM